jgi:hypothetical protein
MGILMIRARFAIPLSMDSRTHQLAYVENLHPFRQSNFSAARISPRIPSWIRSRAAATIVPG